MTADEVVGYGIRKPATVTNGHRHRSLFEYGMKLRGIQMESRQIIKDMRSYNKELDEPLKQKELDKIIVAVIDWEFDNE